MTFHVSTCMPLRDTWQAMCQLAWNMQVSINRGVCRRRKGKRKGKEKDMKGEKGKGEKKERK